MQVLAGLSNLFNHYVICSNYTLVYCMLRIAYHRTFQSHETFKLRTARAMHNTTSMQRSLFNMQQMSVERHLVNDALVLSLIHI